MKNLEYLTERDLEYFYRKAEQGEAVIIYIDPEALLSLDILKLEEYDAASMTEEEIKKLLEKESMILQAAEEGKIYGTFEKMKAMITDDALSEAVVRAQQAGVSTLQIAYILKGDFSDTQKKLAIEAFIRQKEG